MNERPLRVDLHTHVLPRDWPDLEKKYGYGGFVQLEHHRTGCAKMMRDGRCFREITDNSWDPVRRIEECDRTGVDVQVLSTVPVMFSYWAKAADALDLSRFLNDHIAEVCRDHPARFLGLATIPLQDPELAIGELERSVLELGLAGIQIGSHVNEWNLDQRELFPVFARAAELGAAVFVHPWDMLAPERMTRYWLPWLVGMPCETSLALCSVIFGGVLERLPTLRIGFAHGGGSFLGQLGRIEHGFRVRPDLCAVDNPHPPSSYLGRFYVDSLVHDADQLELLVARCSAEKVALGSDYPFPLGEAEPGRLIDSIDSFSGETRRLLLGLSALAFLGVDASKFTR